MTEPGALFGRFQLLGVLGRGGFATVYKAHDPALNRDIALKTLLPHLAEDAEIGRRFLTEVRAIARVSHPNIVTIFEAGEADGHAYYTMELITGQTLAEELQTTGPLPLERALAILRPLAAALDHLHDTGLVHRDVKPANVMLGADGRVLLMDFGIARVLEDTRFTQSGASLGTPAYMAPEQVLDQDVDPPADIYALGIVAYQLLAGRPPFTGATVQVLHAQAYEPPPALRDLCPDLPDPVYEAISAALAKDPALRPASALLLVDQLAGSAAMPSTEPSLEVPINESPTAEMPAAMTTPPNVPVTQPEPLIVQDETLRDVVQPEPLAGQTEVPPAVAQPAPPADQDEALPAALADQDEALPEATTPAPLVDQDAALPEAALPAPLVDQDAALPEATAPPGPPAAMQRGSWRRSRVLFGGIGLAALLVLIGGTIIWAAGRGGNSAGNAATYQQLATDNHYSLTAFAAQAGQPVKVTIRNAGQHQHNLHILNVTDASGNDVRTAFLQGGQSATISFTFKAKGTYAFRCDMYPTEMNGSVNVN